MNTHAKRLMFKFVKKEKDGSWSSYGGMKWEIGKTNVATGPGTQLCTKDVLHCYESPEQAVLFFSQHLQGDVSDYVLLEISTSPVVADDNLKYGTKEQTPVRIISIPNFTIEQRVHFAILCVLKVFKGNKNFETWAGNWISGEDRTVSAARAAADAAYAASVAASVAASAAYAAYAAAYAAYAAADAACAATYAAYAARVDFQQIINQVLNGVSV